MNKDNECNYIMTYWRNCSLEEKLRRLNRDFFFGQN